MYGLGNRATVEVTGIRVDVVDQHGFVDEIMSWTETEGTLRTAVGINAHVCNLADRDPEFGALVRAADFAYADGQSIVWAARLLGKSIPGRVATTDMVFPLADACARRGKRIFMFGSAPGVADRAAARLTALYPGLSIATSHGYVPDQEMPDLIDQINEFDTDILFVGLGDPLQQRWIETYRESLQAKAVLSCGGLFDWTGGVHRRPPNWMVARGLEWFWRVLLEPRRLAMRYLVGNPEFVARVLSQWVRKRLVDTTPRRDRPMHSETPPGVYSSLTSPSVRDDELY